MNDASAAALAVLRHAAEDLIAGAGVPPPLRAIMSTLATSDMALPPPAFFAPRPWRLDEQSLFPLPAREEAKARADPELRRAFGAAYALLPAQDERAVEQVYYLLQEYAWAVPSPGDDATSLFDQARTDAAVAAARADSRDDAPVLLLGGDISGVQDFIYTLTAAGATKALRARSLYLQLLTDAIAGWVLRRAGMPITNLLYGGGGRFYVVLPASVEGAIGVWQSELGRLLLHRHAGEL